MMINIEKLNVSLTKHGAHKVARLLEHFEPDQVLKHTWNKFEGIKIDRPQAAKNLSALGDGTLPGVWAEVKRHGRPAIDGLVMCAIVFSHHELIAAFRAGSHGNGTGTLQRSYLVGTKSFTNAKNNVIELGFATSSDEDQVTYDFSKILSNDLLASLAASLLRLKLSAAGWAGITDFVDECVALKFHDVFGSSEAVFRLWLAGAPINRSTDDVNQRPKFTPYRHPILTPPVV